MCTSVPLTLVVSRPLLVMPPENRVRSLTLIATVPAAIGAVGIVDDAAAEGIDAAADRYAGPE